MNAVKVLIVEDELAVAQSIQRHLKMLGYYVCATAANGRQAIQDARRYRPDLVLIDAGIKGDMDGMEAATRIEKNFKIPSVFLTDSSDALKENLLLQGAYGYIQKPCEAKSLHAVIEVALYKISLERYLKESEHWFASTLRCIADGVVVTDTHGKIGFINETAEKLLGISCDEAKGQSLHSVMALEDDVTGQVVECSIASVIQENKVVGIQFNHLLRSRSGKRIPIDYSVAPIRAPKDTLLGAVLAFRDITERLKAENHLHTDEQRFRHAFNYASVGMALVGLDGRFLQVNQALCKVLNRTSLELIGLNQVTLTYPEDWECEKAAIYGLLSRHQSSCEFEKRYFDAHGKPIWCLVSVSILLESDNPLCFIYHIHDLTYRKEIEEQLARLAHFDSLTGLANRSRLKDEAERQLLMAKRQRRQLAFVFIDLDHFKKVNDSLGHEAGDQLLRVVAERLSSSVRETDCVARLGGDEFVILLTGIKHPDEVSIVTHKIQERFKHPVDLGIQEVMVGMSLGVSLFPDDGRDVNTLIRCADSALYHAKAEGRNNVQYYRPELTVQAQRKLRLEMELRRALEREEFELYYQPIVDLTAKGSGSTVLGAEALIRWHHPQRGLLMPDVFIEVAEEIGIILDIGRWVIYKACHEAVKWAEVSGNKPTVAVNISARQFNSGALVRVIKEALAESGLEPGRLCLEITEHLLLQNIDQTFIILDELKELGVPVAIDDFGMGYSSLSYLKRFNPAKLKIDRSFISDSTRTLGDGALVKAILSMAENLNVHVIAEGVETLEQKNFLSREGCTTAQGYLYSAPRSSLDFIEWIKAQNALNMG